MFGNVDNYTALNERSEYKTMKVPAPEAEHMTEMERMRKNIESESLGVTDYSNPFAKAEYYYYKYETFKVASHSVPTSTLIRAFYE